MRWVRYREGGRVFHGVPREGYAIREGVGNPFPRRIPDHARSAGAAYANPRGVIGEVGETSAGRGSLAARFCFGLPTEKGTFVLR
jgi:hypothetical protein